MVPDLNAIMCQQPEDKKGLRFNSFKRNELLCHYKTECDEFRCECCSEGHQCLCHDFCYDECHCFRSYNKEVDYMNCTARNISSLTSNMPLSVNTVYLDSNNLTHLTLSQVNFTSPERLFLNKSHVNFIEPGTFKQLKKIKQIYLQENELNSLDELIFGDLRSLEGLYLQQNKIKSIGPGSFSQLVSLKHLLLHKNNLSHLDVRLFDSLKSLQSISLHDNPCECDCTFGPEFQKWLVINTEGITNPRKITCRNIKSGNISIMDIDFFYCHHPKIIGGLVSLSAVFILIGLLIVIVYRNRLLIMVWAYNRYGVRFRREEEDNEGKPYDVFVANTPADELFVIEEMLPRLEDPDGLNYKVGFKKGSVINCCTRNV